MQPCGGVILCGGKSSRMGTPKAWLKFGDETALARVVRLLQPLVSPIVVVAAQDQDLPPLPKDVRIVRDEFESCGPLAGLAVGLQALAPDVPAAYCTSCDVPLLQPPFVKFLIDSLDRHDIAVVRDVDFWHPLAAVYRTHLAPQARALVEQNQRRMIRLFDHANTRHVTIEEIRAADPDLVSLRNINTPDEYASILEWLSKQSPT